MPAIQVIYLTLEVWYEKYTRTHLYINSNTIAFVLKGIIFLFMVSFNLLACKVFWQGLVKCSKGNYAFPCM